MRKINPKIVMDEELVQNVVMDGIFGIFIVSSTRPQMHCLTRRFMSVIRMVSSAFW